MMYCLDLLENTGIATVPGSGFGQEPNTFHFRMAILSCEKTALPEALNDILKFHKGFMEKYS